MRLDVVLFTLFLALAFIVGTVGILAALAVMLIFVPWFFILPGLLLLATMTLIFYGLLKSGY